MIPPHRLRQITRGLREAFPASGPVRVRQVKLKEAFAETFRTEKGNFTIHVDPRLTWEVGMQMLLHEWAHVVTWIHDHGRAHVHHTDEWGRVFARIIRWSNGERRGRGAVV